MRLSAHAVLATLIILLVQPIATQDASAQEEEGPVLHLAVAHVDPGDEEAFSDQIQKLVTLSEDAQLGGGHLFFVYKADNKWGFVSPRPRADFLGALDPKVVSSLNDTDAKERYRSIVAALDTLVVRSERQQLNQINRWSYAPEDAPEHDRFAIVQEWELKPDRKHRIGAIMDEFVTFAEEIGYPYVFDTYRVDGAPGRIAFVVWTDDLGRYYDEFAGEALAREHPEAKVILSRLASVLDDYDTTINRTLSGHSFVPR